MKKGEKVTSPERIEGDKLTGIDSRLKTGPLFLTNLISAINCPTSYSVRYDNRAARPHSTSISANTRKLTGYFSANLPLVGRSAKAISDSKTTSLLLVIKLERPCLLYFCTKQELECQKSSRL